MPTTTVDSIPIPDGMEICYKCGGNGGQPGGDFGDYGFHSCYRCGESGYLPLGTCDRECNENKYV